MPNLGFRVDDVPPDTRNVDATLEVDVDDLQFGRAILREARSAAWAELGRKTVGRRADDNAIRGCLAHDAALTVATFEQPAAFRAAADAADDAAHYLLAAIDELEDDYNFLAGRIANVYLPMRAATLAETCDVDAADDAARWALHDDFVDAIVARYEAIPTRLVAVAASAASHHRAHVRTFRAASLPVSASFPRRRSIRRARTRRRASRMATSARAPGRPTGADRPRERDGHPGETP